MNDVEAGNFTKGLLALEKMISQIIAAAGIQAQRLFTLLDELCARDRIPAREKRDLMTLPDKFFR